MSTPGVTLTVPVADGRLNPSPAQQAMKTLFGLPVLEIVNPDGEVAPYLVCEVPTPGQRSVWLVTKEDGTKYQVEEVLRGGWRCNCPDTYYRGWLRTCKHIRAVVEHLGRRD